MQEAAFALVQSIDKVVQSTGERKRQPSTDIAVLRSKVHQCNTKLCTHFTGRPSGYCQWCESLHSPEKFHPCSMCHQIVDTDLDDPECLCPICYGGLDSVSLVEDKITDYYLKRQWIVEIGRVSRKQPMLESRILRDGPMFFMGNDKWIAPKKLGYLPCFDAHGVCEEKDWFKTVSDMTTQIVAQWHADDNMVGKKTVAELRQQQTKRFRTYQERPETHQCHTKLCTNFTGRHSGYCQWCESLQSPETFHPCSMCHRVVDTDLDDPESLCSICYGYGGQDSISLVEDKITDYYLKRQWILEIGRVSRKQPMLDSRDLCGPMFFMGNDKWIAPEKLGYLPCFDAHGVCEEKDWFKTISDMTTQIVAQWDADNKMVGKKTVAELRQQQAKQPDLKEKHVVKDDNEEVDDEYEFVTELRQQQTKQPDLKEEHIVKDDNEEVDDEDEFVVELRQQQTKQPDVKEEHVVKDDNEEVDDEDEFVMEEVD